MENSEIKHLEFIQGIINRSNSNSFQIKNWMITIVTALLALYASSKGNVVFIFVAIAPTTIFWFLDAYYLQQERKFRKLYDAIVDGRSDIATFKMPINKFDSCYFEALFSKTIFPLYGFIILGILVAGLILNGVINFNC